VPDRGLERLLMGLPKLVKFKAFKNSARNSIFHGCSPGNEINLVTTFRC
jgi:hypothetical protein